MKKSISIFIFLSLFIIFIFNLSVARGSENNADKSEDLFQESIPRTDNPLIISPGTVEEREINIQFHFACTPYKDNTATEYYSPVLIRIATGSSTEFRIGSGFLEYQNPNTGFNDVVLGFKWKFKKSNPRMAILTNLELPTGSGGFGDKAVEPSVSLLFDYQFDEKWDFAFNTTWGNKNDNANKDRYNQAFGGVQLGYNINEDNNITFAIGGKYPTNSLDGIGISAAAVGYNLNINPNLQLSVNVVRGLSSIDKAWIFDIGINYLIK